MAHIKNMKLIHILILLYSMNIYSSFLEDKIGYNPYLKKLNNNKYIVISSKGIIFLDETLTKFSSDIIFEEEAYKEFEDIFSTTVAQFPEEDDSLILAIINDKLYIFHSNETLLINQTIIPKYSEYRYKKPYYLLPYSKSSNTYVTIFLDLVNFLDNSIYLTITNIIYNYDTNTINLSEKIVRILEQGTFRFTDIELDSTIGCGLLKDNNNLKILNCISGVYQSQIINFDPEKNFSIISKEIYQIKIK